MEKTLIPITKELEIEKNGVKGKELHIGAKDQAIYRRLQFFLDNQYAYQLDVYNNEEELFGKNVDQFFDSFEITSKPEYDIKASKTNAILKGLHTKDSTLHKKALYAVTSYYEFIEEDVEPLFEAIPQTYPNDTSAYKIGASLFDNLEPLLTKAHIPELTKLYHHFKDSTYLSNSILHTIAEVDSLNNYFNLLINETPKQSDFYTYAVLQDSLPFVADNYKKLLPLVDLDGHRHQILSLTNILLNDSKYKTKIDKYLPQVTQYALQDLETEQSDLYKIQNYFPLIKTANNKKLANKFSKNLLQKETSNWIKAKVVDLRLKYNLKIKSSLIDTLLKDKETKFETIKTLHQAGQIKKIPSKYLSSERFSNLAFDTYLYDDYYFADSLTLLGKLKEPDGTYYAYQIAYEDDEENFIGIIGPFNEPSINFEYKCLTNWDVIEEDWQKQAKALINGQKAEE